MAEKKPEENPEKKPTKETGMIAAILIRGLIGIRAETKTTLSLLRLRKKHACAIIKRTPVVDGMLMKCKDFITYGPVSDATVAELKKARKPVNDKGTLVFNLAPPRGGFERGGIKRTHRQGGVLGIRNEMDTLLKKMM